MHVKRAYVLVRSSLACSKRSDSGERCVRSKESDKK